VTVAEDHEEADGQFDTDLLLVFVTVPVYEGEPGVTVAEDREEADGQAVTERLLVFVTLVV